MSAIGTRNTIDRNGVRYFGWTAPNHAGMYRSRPMENQAREASLMHPLAEASVEKIVPTKRNTMRKVESVRRAASNRGVIACPRYSHGIRPTQTYHVIVAAISRV